MKLLNPFDLPKKMSIKFKKYSPDSKEHLFIISNEDINVLISLSPPKFGKPDIPDFYVDQTEFPKSALSQIAKTIEEKFWRSASEGGLPAGVNRTDIFVNGEKISIYREMNVGAPHRKGFRVTNFSRPSRKYEEDFQDFWLTDDELLNEGVLQAFKECA
ncbi:hypothetical protein EXT46_06455 [Pseudoalteromonas sp. CO325X]|uniref:hypothetical protein n=1 Tax=Pseudoalteromonas sp. CO325X TaxID=1777262 RepID=UPI001023D7C4|nr:hypothetical protein [Pseudoalteromonas sp. CO325X]RZF83091.1 hypothetical protein EXT46_06455 [Pseudoalteromonas sp. CO325X]|tara:strand:+ start:1130 stop:1606 length:477 start_codon:yes stop_codon:yes gene_type:complete